MAERAFTLIDPCSKIKIEPNDVQRSIRAYEVIKQTKLSLFEWFKKTNKYFDQKEFVKILIDIPREELLTKIMDSKSYIHKV